ncbi:MAG: Redoxin [Acidimicrobiales bacterium]|nr:Redoxin [Acidimicrobiales bacterium]
MTTFRQPSDRGPLVWYVVIAVVVVLAIVALVAVKASDDGGGGSDGTSKGVAGAVEASDVVIAESSAPALDPLPEEGADPAVGKTSPTVTGRTLAGKPITIGPDGKAKIIVFAAHWCPHCQKELPILVDHLADSPLPDDVDLVTVSTGVDEKAPNYPPSAWLDEIGWTAPTLADSPDALAATTYGLSSYPYFVVVDRDGKVVARANGEISTDTFDDLVTAAQEGVPAG